MMMALAGCLACDDEDAGNGGGGGDAQADTGGDTAIDTPDDVAADGTDVTADTQEDGVEDTVPEVSEDAVDDLPIGDVAEDGGDQGDGPPDVLEDLPPPDVQEEPEPAHFESCPYETPSVDLDCTALCGAVDTCSGDPGNCDVGCTSAELFFSQDTADALEACVTGEGACDAVPEGSNLGDYCFVTATQSAVASESVVTACEGIVERWRCGEDFTACSPTAPIRPHTFGPRRFRWLRDAPRKIATWSSTA
jgi:hypothetical protein